MIIIIVSISISVVIVIISLIIKYINNIGELDKKIELRDICSTSKNGVCKPLFDDIEKKCKDQKIYANACELKIKLGKKGDVDDTHITIAWILGCKVKKEEIIEKVVFFLRKKYNKTKMIVPVILGNIIPEFNTSLSVCVLDELAIIKKDVMSFLLRENIDIEMSTAGVTPYISIQTSTKCKDPVSEIDVLDINIWDLSKITNCGKSECPFCFCC